MTQWQTSPQSARCIQITTEIVGFFGGKMRFLKALGELEIYRVA